MKRITLVLCMLLVLACGSSAFALEGTYKIGVMVPLTGAQAEYGIGQKCAAEMAVEEINAAGGINGKELVIDVVDSGSDIETSVELARKFVEDEEVMFILSANNFILASMTNDIFSPCSISYIYKVYFL